MSRSGWKILGCVVSGLAIVAAIGALVVVAIVVAIFITCQRMAG